MNMGNTTSIERTIIEALETPNLAGAIPVTILLTKQRICDMFVGAFEGGSTYWLEEANQLKGETPEHKGIVWWGSENIYQPSLQIEIAYDEEQGGEELTKKVISWDNIVRGARKMSSEAPRHFADIMTENDDASTADIFLQYCVFGEIVYG